MALAFTGLGAKFEATAYTGPLVVSGLSLSSGDLLIVTGTAADIAGDQYVIGTGTPTLDSSWGTITDLGISSGSGYFGDPITQAWTVAVTSTGSSRSVTLPGGSDGSFGAFVGLTVAKVTGHNTSSPIGAKLSGTSTTNNLTTSTLTTTNANAYVYASGVDGGSYSAPSSSDLTYTAYALSSGSALVGWKSATTAGNYTANLDSAAVGSTSWGYVVLEVKIASSSTAWTATGSATITATGTAAMSNARVGVGSGSETATGTAAASNQRTLAASASATASGTAAMSSTQAMSASGSVTATGTATGSTSSPSSITISGSATITGTGTSTASVATAQTATATGTVVATGSVDFFITPVTVMSSNGTVVASGSTAMAKTMQLEATVTVTAASSAGMTHTFYIFSPPTREISPVSLDPYFQLVGYLQGRTLVRRNGVWKLVQNKKQEYLDQSEYVFLGGCQNRINGEEKAALESAGYTVETRTS